MEQILQRIGFVRVLRFEKRRETWTLEGCEVALDELPRLGRFVEIEGPSDAAVMQVRQKLALEEAPLLTSSYVAMLSHRLNDRDAHPRDVRFE
jgi:adenylate cyclase class IV